MPTSKYSNKFNLSLSVAAWLARDEYDHNPDPNTVSATQIIKPIRQQILGSRVPEEDTITDVSQVVASRIGTAVHNAIEATWSGNNFAEPLKLLGIPKRLIKAIRVNPLLSAITDKIIPIFMEQRWSRQIDVDGVIYNITGKADFVPEGELEDFKTTKVYKYISGSSDNSYIMQGSIYRWIKPNIITGSVITINFIFTDWSPNGARGQKDYPPAAVAKRSFHLKPQSQIDTYLRERIKTLVSLQHAPQEDLPLCTPEELWQRETVWKYYKNPDKRTKSTKNFDNDYDAKLRLVNDGNVGVVVEVPGEVIACKYCAGFTVCDQKDDLVASGLLKL